MAQRLLHVDCVGIDFLEQQHGYVRVKKRTARSGGPRKGEANKSPSLVTDSLGRATLILIRS